MKIEVKFWVGMDVAQPMWLPHFPANKVQMAISEVKPSFGPRFICTTEF